MDIAPAKSKACSKINSEPRKVSCTQVVGLAGIQPPPAAPTCQPLRSFAEMVLQRREKGNGIKRRKGVALIWTNHTAMPQAVSARIVPTSQTYFLDFAHFFSCGETIHECFLNVVPSQHPGHTHPPPKGRPWQWSMDVNIGIPPPGPGSGCMVHPVQLSVTHICDLLAKPTLLLKLKAI